MSLFLEALNASRLPKEVRDAQRGAQKVASDMTAERLDRQREFRESLDKVRRKFGPALDPLRDK